MRLRLLALTVVVAACGGDASRSPACGLALIAAPTLIQQQLNNARAVITDPPRGLPDSLPAMVIHRSDVANHKDIRNSGYGEIRCYLNGPGTCSRSSEPSCDSLGKFFRVILRYGAFPDNHCPPASLQQAFEVFCVT